MTESPNQAESIQKLRELTEDIHIAMLTTVDADGALRSRPMGTRAIEPDGSLWFFTETDAAKVGEVARDQQVNVAFSHPTDRWVSASGTATLVRDHEKMRQLWNPFVQAWFPQGPDGDNIALLRVQVTQAEYWEAPGGAVVQLFKIARSVITHQPPTDIGTNQTVTISDETAR
jgi:general stress protein 26